MPRAEKKITGDNIGCVFRAIDNIKYLSKRKGILMKDLERRCGVSTGYFSRYNEGTPALRFLLAASVLEVPIGDLFCREFEREDEIERIKEEMVNAMSPEEVQRFIRLLTEKGNED